MSTIASPKDLIARHRVRDVVTLSSGLPIEIKRIDTLGLVMSSKVSVDDIEAIMQDVGSWASKPPEAIAAAVLEHADRYARVLDACVTAACVRPRVSLENTDDPEVLWIEDLVLLDKLVILNAAKRLVPEAVQNRPLAPTPASAPPAVVTQPTPETVTNLETA